MACEARQPDRRGGAASASAPRSAAVTPARTVSAPTTIPLPPAPPATIVKLTQTGGVPRFGLVTKLRNGHVCLTMEGDSLTDSTAVATVAYKVSERGDSSKALVRALVVGYSRECADSLRMIE